MSAEEGRRPTCRSRRYAIVVLAVVLVVVLALLSRRLPLGELVGSLALRVRAAGALGVVIYALVYVVACVALIPASLLTLAAGFIYGPIWGTVLVSPASVLGASAAFAIGRTLGRSAIERRVGSSPRFRALDQAIGGGGLTVVTLLRLSPILPFTLLNYALSLTQVRFQDFLIGSFAGMLPATILYVYLGSLASSLTELAGGKSAPSTARQALFVLGLAATVAVTVIVSRRARRALDRQLGAEPPSGGFPDGGENQ